MNIIEKLEEDANWIEGNASYQLGEDQNLQVYDRQQRIVKNIRKVAELLRSMGVTKNPFA